MNVVTTVLKTVVGAAAIAGSALIGLLSVPNGCAQSQPAKRPEFEVASIRPHQGMITVVGLDISGSRVTVSASTLSDLITDAYRLNDYQLAGVAD